MKKIKILTVLALIIFFTFSCEEEKVDFERYGSLSGVILDGESYEPLAGVLVATSPASSSVITTSDGRFLFSKILEGQVTVTARKSDYASNNVLVSVYEDEQTEMSLTLLKDDEDYGSVIIYDPVPGNGAVDQLSSFDMEWKVDQSRSGFSYTYDVFLFESNSTTQKVVGEGITEKKVVVDGLKDETTYFWYVVAKYEGDIVANSPTWSFKTGNNEQ